MQGSHSIALCLEVCEVLCRMADSELWTCSVKRFNTLRVVVTCNVNLVLLSCRWLVVDLQLQHCALQPMCSLASVHAADPPTIVSGTLYLLSSLTLGCCTLHDALAGTPCLDKSRNEQRLLRYFSAKSKDSLHARVASVATYIHACASSVPTCLQAASTVWQHTWHAAAVSAPATSQADRWLHTVAVGAIKPTQQRTSCEESNKSHQTTDVQGWTLATCLHSHIIKLQSNVF